MTIQYNVPVKVLDSSKKSRIQTALQPYSIFTDCSGNLEDTCFSYENRLGIGEIVIVKTLKKEAAQVAHEVLSGIEGLLVLPINECNLEEDKARISHEKLKAEVTH